MRNLITLATAIIALGVIGCGGTTVVTETETAPTPAGPSAEDEVNRASQLGLSTIESILDYQDDLNREIDSGNLVAACDIVDEIDDEIDVLDEQIAILDEHREIVETRGTDVDDLIRNRNDLADSTNDMQDICNTGGSDPYGDTQGS